MATDSATFITSLRHRLLTLAILTSLLSAFVIVLGSSPANAAGFTVYAPWDSGKRFAVGNPPGSGIGGGYYGHCCSGYTTEYYAVDINGPGGGNTDCGENVRATNSGKVSAVGTYAGGISYIRVDHGGGYTSEYQHVTNRLAVGVAVTQGMVIAKFGNVGTTYCHLHFIVKLNGKSVPPSPMSGVTLPSTGGAWVTSNNSSGSAAPFGSFDAADPTNNGIHVRGWAIDPDTNNPIDVHVYVDGAGYPTTASVPRPDVDAVYHRGANHGFDFTVPVGPGTHNVCAFGINYGGGTNPQLGCRTYTTPPGVPFGSFDAADPTNNGIHVRGWAIDPDTNNPIDVHVYVDGAGYPTTANVPRPDVDAVYHRGANHGFDFTVPVGPGTHNVCAFGINYGGGTNPQLGCKTYTTPPSIVGDLTGDGLVNCSDVHALNAAWGTSSPAADLSKDGIVDVKDLSILLSHWTGPNDGTC